MIERHKNGHLLLAMGISVLGAIGGAGSGSYIYFSQLAPNQLEALVRPDPFTGVQGRELIARIVALEAKVSTLPPRELITEMALLRQELAFLRVSLNKLERVVEEKVDK